MDSITWRPIIWALVIGFGIYSLISSVLSYLNTYNTDIGYGVVVGTWLLILLVGLIFIGPLIVANLAPQKGLLHGFIAFFLLLIMGILFLVILAPEVLLELL